MSTRLIGRHVSATGGAQNAPERAAAIGCNCFQFFSRSPRGGKVPELTHAVVVAFKANMEKHRQRAAFIHTPYYINLASSNDRIRYGSISIIREELERASLLGVDAVMTHLGSAKDCASRAEANAMVIKGIKKILSGYMGAAQFLIENAAGAGDILGVGFEEIGNIIKKSEASGQKSSIGVCLDTAHAFASGYDLRTTQDVAAMLKDFDKHIGLDRLVMIHINDSKTEFNARRDRHEHIGEGKIGTAGFRAMLVHPNLKKVSFVLETPEDVKGDERDVRALQHLAK